MLAIGLQVGVKFTRDSVRAIAEAHDGEVRYDRTTQARSVFTLTLPLAPEAPYA